MKEEVGEIWFIKGVKKVRFALYHRIFKTFSKEMMLKIAFSMCLLFHVIL